MTCREVTEFLMDYVARELPADVLAGFEYHLSRCPNCRTFLAQYQDTVKAGKLVFDKEEADVTTALPAELLKAIMEAVKAPGA